jgi:hypothetical protein
MGGILAKKAPHIGLKVSFGSLLNKSLIGDSKETLDEVQ